MLLLEGANISNFCNFSLVATCVINSTLIYIVKLYIYTQESVLKESVFKYNLKKTTHVL